MIGRKIGVGVYTIIIIPIPIPILGIMGQMGQTIMREPELIEKEQPS